MHQVFWDAAFWLYVCLSVCSSWFLYIFFPKIYFHLDSLMPHLTDLLFGWGGYHPFLMADILCLLFAMLPCIQ